MASSSAALVSSLPPVQLPPPRVAQRFAIADPIYETVNEGLQHVPKFRCTVRVDGLRFTFMRRKAAEQEAARIALECLTKKIKEEGHSFVREVHELVHIRQLKTRNKP